MKAERRKHGPPGKPLFPPDRSKDLPYSRARLRTFPLALTPSHAPHTMHPLQGAEWAMKSRGASSPERGASQLPVEPRGWLPSETVTLAYLLIFSGLILVFSNRIADWGLHLGIHAGLILTLFAVMEARRRWEHWLPRLLRHWYAVPFVPICFLELGALVEPINPQLFDHLLWKADVALGLENWPRWMEAITTPWLTELSKVCWILYFFLPVLFGLPLYLRRDLRPFQQMMLLVLAGWFLSYLGYVLTPAIGLGYHLDELGVKPPGEGVFATQALREAVHTMERPLVDSGQQLGPMRDAYPSGHTIIAALLIWGCFRHRVTIGWLLVPICCVMIFSTLYLRYHYFVDIVAGLLITLCLIAIVPRWHRRALHRAERGHDG